MRFFFKNDNVRIYVYAKRVFTGSRSDLLHRMALWWNTRVDKGALQPAALSVASQDFY